MKRKTKIGLYLLLISIGLTIFILQLFVFEAPDGILGFLLCLTSIYLIFGGVIKVCQLSKLFKNSLIDSLNLLFFIK